MTECNSMNDSCRLQNAEVPNSLNPNLQHLDKLRADSTLSSGEKAGVAAMVGARETLNAGPAIYIAGLGISGGTFVGLKTAQTVDQIQRDVSGMELGREEKAIKRDFAQELNPNVIKGIEKQCAPSTLDKIETYASDVGQDGLYGAMSGWLMTPMTGGFSLPALGIAGVTSGALNARDDLNFTARKCEVNALREHILGK